MTTTKRDRIQALLKRLDELDEIRRARGSLPLHDEAWFPLDAAGLVPRWSVLRGPGSGRHSLVFISTPAQPRDPSVPWAVPPSEFQLHRDEAIALLI